MTVRAVYLEVLHSLSTDSFMPALHRFINRLGNIAHMFSDNGSNFVGADRALKAGVGGGGGGGTDGALKERIKQWNQSQIIEFL